MMRRMQLVNGQISSVLVIKIKNSSLKCGHKLHLKENGKSGRASSRERAKRDWSSDVCSSDLDVFNSANQGIIVTDQTGKIVSVNNAFVKITGYDEKDAIGERANILSSGNQDKELFAEMWKQITSKGEW